MFEWDEGKRRRNIEERGIDFVDVLPLFSDDARLVFEDLRKDYGEARHILYGILQGNLYQVVFVKRGENTRIISARRANKRERRLYGRRKDH